MIHQPQEYADVVRALAPVLHDLPGKLIAIDGRDGVGKTSLARFLAWRFNVSLLETDLFLYGRRGLMFRHEEIDRIVTRRLAMPRPIIIEGVAVLRVLESLDREPDYLVYVKNKQATGNRELLHDLRVYEQEYYPEQSANLVVEFSSFNQVSHVVPIASRSKCRTAAIELAPSIKPPSEE